MAKRYYICDVIGDGSDADPYRASVADSGAAVAAVMPDNDPQTGRPLVSWCLAIVSATNHAPILADARNDRMPDFPLDGKVNAINAAAKGLMRAALIRRGLDADALIDGKDGFREVVRGIGRALSPVFDENAFDVAG